MSYIGNPFYNVFNSQKSNQFAVAKASYKERINKLNALKNAIENTHKDAIREAIYADFKKPYTETDLTEIYPVIGDIKFAKQQLKSWMKRQKVETPLALLGSSSWYIYEPKGVCLIISPWNFPLNLTFGPLVSAIAAGNTVIIKPSEMTPHISKVMKAIISELFSENEVALIEGGVKTSQALLELPFNHIFFTGSPQVGKVVMKAASNHLASVTLELGGKSPAIIDDTIDLKTAVKRLVWGKFVNNGQTCIAPDYVFIKASIKDVFIAEIRNQLQKFYSTNAETSDSYSRIVNKKHFNRLVSYLQDAKRLSATIEIGGQTKQDDCYIAPTVVSNLPEDSLLLQEEIFGPILPIKIYDNIDEVITYINTKEKPLALYIYSKHKRTIDKVISNTRAGTSCINNNVVQYSNHNLPFGGSNNSGIGKSHGYFGFQEFSNMRSVMKQHNKGSVEFLFPPYTTLKQKIVDITLKWF
ncbi:aldehyde dehydrogenase family protein [Corallibacter sp.]|uniref:aldehyde dehydrogenase family protein n=1 Tax=Corallibacter sp. TaxID=2038084 RepID=UPI003AB71C5B